MGIQIISKDERLSTEISGVTFTYRRISETEQGVIERKHESKGRVNWRSVTEDILKRCLLDWDGVTDTDGHPLPFDAKLIAWLPSEVRGELAELFYANDPGKDLVKNSDAGSKDSTAIEG